MTGYVAKATDSATWDNLDDTKDTMQEGDRMYAVDLSAKLGVVDSYVTYYKADTENDNEIWNVGVAVPVVKDLKLSAEYLHGNDQNDGDNNGYVVGLAYKALKLQSRQLGVYANTMISRRLPSLNTPLTVMLRSTSVPLMVKTQLLQEQLMVSKVMK